MNHSDFLDVIYCQGLLITVRQESAGGLLSDFYVEGRHALAQNKLSERSGVCRLRVNCNTARRISLTRVLGAITIGIE